MAEGTGAPRSGGEPRRGDGLALEAADVNESENAAPDGVQRAVAPRRIDQGRRAAAGYAGSRGEILHGFVRLGSDARRDDALRLDTRVEPVAELADTGRSIARTCDRDADSGKTFASELRAHIVAHAHRVLGAQQVTAIEHHQLVP
ncbi:MAG: hypothetical protein E6I48_15880 [Chloroflexi bacterium]|nr:MAG: hypothetical protein E6I48_15880 [Chloroflexota bacterium]